MGRLGRRYADADVGPACWHLQDHRGTWTTEVQLYRYLIGTVVPVSFYCTFGMNRPLAKALHKIGPKSKTKRDFY